MGSMEASRARHGRQRGGGNPAPQACGLHPEAIHVYGVTRVSTLTAGSMKSRAPCAALNALRTTIAHDTPETGSMGSTCPKEDSDAMVAGVIGRV